MISMNGYRSYAGVLAMLVVAVAFDSCGRATPSPKHVEPAVTIARSGTAKARVIVLTQGVAIKENGPADTIRAFGEVYAFVPQTIVVRLDEPTEVVFWNLQPDDEHDFMLTDPANKVLVQSKLPPLSRTTFVMTFHERGVFPFYCTRHQPAMSGQILVVGNDHSSN